MVRFSSWLYIATLCFTVPTAAYSREPFLFEKQRQQLCISLHEAERCEKSCLLFGSAPENSVMEYVGYERCSRSDAYECVPTSLELLPNQTAIQKNIDYKIRHTLTITAKNSVTKVWDAIEWNSNEFENDRTESLEYEFDRVNQYFWVQHDYYEGRSVALFSHDTGRSYVFEDIVIPSPDGSHILVKKNEDPFIRLYLFNTAIEEVARFNIGDLTKNKTFSLLWITSDEIAVVDGLQMPVRSLARVKRQDKVWALVLN